MVQTYNTIELRYADSELAKNQFVVESDYTALEQRVAKLYEENEILRNDRAHWYHMYNAVSAPSMEMPEQ